MSLECFLTNFMPLVSFVTPWKHWKTCGFLFSGAKERDQWHKWVKSLQNFEHNFNFLNEAMGEEVSALLSAFYIWLGLWFYYKRTSLCITWTFQGDVDFMGNIWPAVPFPSSVVISPWQCSKTSCNYNMKKEYNYFSYNKLQGDFKVEILFLI